MTNFPPPPPSPGSSPADPRHPGQQQPGFHGGSQQSPLSPASTRGGHLAPSQPLPIPPVPPTRGAGAGQGTGGPTRGLGVVSPIEPAPAPARTDGSGPVSTEGQSFAVGISPGAPPLAIEMRGLRAAYGRIEVLHGIDLAVPHGSVFALFGPNGAGKTTMLKVAGGRMRPSAGSVLMDGKELGKASAHKLAHAGLCSIPEGRGIFPNLTVRDNLRIWTYQGKISLADAEERSYTRFPKLGERRRQLAGTMSGGEQQMLAFARALVGKPKILLLDEISMGLAPLIVSELYDVVAQLASEGITILLVEQFVQTAMHVATRAAIVVHGRVERVGEPAEIAEAAMSAYLSGSA